MESSKRRNNGSLTTSTRTWREIWPPISPTKTLCSWGGARTELWSQFWPNSDLEPYGPHINRTPKFVVSSTLERVAWGQWDNVSLLRGDKLSGEITRLKQQPGKNIGVAGSPTLVASLLRDGLLDELGLIIHPVVVGRGKRLFDDWGDLKRLTLVHSETTSSGVVFAIYRSRRNG